MRAQNALIKQYARLFDMDGVKLEFEPEALEAIAKSAISRKTGARLEGDNRRDTDGRDVYSAFAGDGGKVHCDKGKRGKPYYAGAYLPTKRRRQDG